MRPANAPAPSQSHNTSSIDVLHSSATFLHILGLSKLRIRFLVARVVDLEEHHHRVIFVNDVMAMYGVSPDKVAESEKHLRLHVVLQSEHVLAPRLNDPGSLRSLVVDPERLEFLEVHVNRVLPAARVVLENPSLDRVTLDGEADIVARCELPVDSPLTVVPLEPENACDQRRCGRGREVIKVNCLARGDIRGVDAVVGHDWTIDDDLQDLIALTGTQNVARWTTPVLLLQTVLDVERLALKSGEVDDHVHTFSHRDAATVRNLHRLLKKVSVDADLPDRFAGIISRVEQ